MARKLKIFRTAVGFHDAYVAAPSRKAALEAWGAAKDLFASGRAEEVSDTTQHADVLGQPGIVVRKSRGSAKDQIAANAPAGADAPRTESKDRRRRPRPKRTALDAAEAELAALDERAAAAERQFRRREEALARERGEMQRGFAIKRTRARQKVDRARETYERRMADWQP